MPTDETPSRFPGGGGSLRDPRAHRAALDAAVELLTEVGYSGLTMAGIAKRSGVSKPTLYRWWRSIAELVHEAISEPSPDIPPDTGDLETDLRRFVTRLTAHYARPEVIAATPGLIADLMGPQAPRPAAYPGNQVYLTRINKLFSRAVAEGRLRPDADTAAAADMIIGAVISQALARLWSGRPPIENPEQAADSIVSVALHGLCPPAADTGG
ncbi:MAG: TetR/AcrR family transcriptional regulator [Streptomycetaceae bacterium]|jgi:AcrR family transcriptional regulator|nr:TetR/AcrR family transcriptional regulator [Streptomycetaceae bacterium]